MPKVPQGQELGRLAGSDIFSIQNHFASFDSVSVLAQRDDVPHQLVFSETQLHDAGTLVHVVFALAHVRPFVAHLLLCGAALRLRILLGPAFFLSHIVPVLVFLFLDLLVAFHIPFSVLHLARLVPHAIYPSLLFGHRDLVAIYLA